ncbi:protein AMBP [Brienomyrus brachyistius]|uniref:protein AMBP n=1 Tax=Brienomyrus brachyistius TaxID=42636 RepID=UPI0020B400D3|nr:protein AMBP [Brienomyrus brachyistius]
MHITVLLPFLLLAVGTPAFGGPLPSEPALQPQENFDLTRFMGKWHDIAVASNCPWIQKHKDHLSAGTIEINQGVTSNTLNLTRTAIRRGECKQKFMSYEVTDTSGKLSYHNAKWKADVDAYVVRTNYHEYAIVVMRTQKQGGNKTTTLKLYGRSPDLRSSLVEEFTQLAKEQGLNDDAIIILTKTKECVPGNPAQLPEIQRLKRNVVLPSPEEGSAVDTPMFINEDSCMSPPDAGPCFAMFSRYFYNSTLMACQEFIFGGCLGNQNNFLTEKACLQTCRTEAACRLPIAPGKCTGQEQLWAFDSISGKCVSFKYGGCKGNGNKFYSQRECEEYCGVIKDGDEDLMKVN